MDVIAPLFLQAHVGQLCAPCHSVHFIHPLSLSTTCMFLCIFDTIVLDWALMVLMWLIAWLRMDIGCLSFPRPLLYFLTPRCSPLQLLYSIDMLFAYVVPQLQLIGDQQHLYSRWGDDLQDNDTPPPNTAHDNVHVRMVHSYQATTVCLMVWNTTMVIHKLLTATISVHDYTDKIMLWRKNGTNCSIHSKYV